MFTILSECRTPDGKLLFLTVMYRGKPCISIKQRGFPATYMIPLDELNRQEIVTAVTALGEN